MNAGRSSAVSKWPMSMAELLLFHHAQGLTAGCLAFADDRVLEGDLDAARQLVKIIKGAELFLYPGNRHLFADSSLPDYDESAATLLKQRVLSFLHDLE